MDLLLDLQQITRRFGNFEALKDVTLKLPPGRIGLLGPNGAGKSTLLKILMGLLAPSSGTGTILGKSLDGLKEDRAGFALRQQIGFMTEVDALVPGLTGIDYVALAGELCGMPRRHAVRRAHEVLTFLELEEARYRNLEGYSTGMKQRIKLAQALVHDPPLLLLDEPTSGLDPAGRDAMLRLLIELGRDFGKSIILSTHLLADVETVCDQVVILLGGVVRNVGTVRELCARRHDRYALKIWGDSTSFQSQLQQQGIELLPEVNRGEIRVVVPTEWKPRQFFELAQQSGTILRGMLRDDESLEEMFLRTAVEAKA
jgi:ABC-2 type transport system ATP-binding protein